MRAMKGLPLVLLLVIGACAEPEATAPDASTAGPAFLKGVTLTPVQQLGKSIYFDMNLSLNRNQACASCHHPKAGFASPNGDDSFNLTGGVIQGSVPGRFGNRKPPSAAYATLSPRLDLYGDLFIGGNFWDGRATGWGFDNPAHEQSLGPFLNPDEQALRDNACVVYRVCNGKKDAYPVGMADVFGAEVCAIDWPKKIDKMCEVEGDPFVLADDDKVDAAYYKIGSAIAAFEGSPEVNQYSSKYDAYLAGLATLTTDEQEGLELFEGDALCSACHITDLQPNLDPPLFTDFTFDNLGIPINPLNPAYMGTGFIDPGLGGFLEDHPDWSGYAVANMGKHKVPTLRNLDQRTNWKFVRAYGHNGYFKSIAGIVHFYNTRDCALKADAECTQLPYVMSPCPAGSSEEYALANHCWPEPEVLANVNEDELGNLGLTLAQEAKLVAFLKTLNDGYFK